MQFDGRTLSRPEQNVPATARYFSPVTPVRRDYEGREWMNSGYRLEVNGQTVFKSQYLIHDFLIDRHDQIWLTTYQGGLQLLARPVLETLGTASGELADPNVYLVTDIDGKIYAGNGSELNRFDPSRGGWTSVWDGAARSLLAERDGLLVGGRGLCRLEAPG